MHVHAGLFCGLPVFNKGVALMAKIGMEAASSRP